MPAHLERAAEMWSAFVRRMRMMNPELVSLGFGGVAGATVGFATKKLTKLAAILLGVLFILIQGLVYLGWIQVDWQAVERTTQGIWVDPSGTTLADRAWSIVTANLPFAGGFTAGFALGFKLG